MADLMKGKRGLVMGVANDRSIAWGIAKAMAAEGAELAFTYQGEGFGKRVTPLAASVGSDLVLDVDVTNERFGDVTGPEAGGAEEFLKQLEDEGRIRDYDVDWFSGSTTDIDEGRWPIVFNVKLFAPQQEIILIANIGQTVDIVEES